MAGPHPVNCPSGLQIEVRGLKAKEANLLAEQGNRNAATAFDTILKSCCLAVGELGPYKLGPDALLPWPDVLVGDRFTAILGVRIATHGPEYHFPVKCGECGHKYEWEIDLAELPVKPFPPASLVAFREGRPLTTTLNDGRTVAYKLLTGAGEAQAAKMLKNASASVVTTSLATRITAIEGVDPADKLTFLAELDLGEVSDLIAKFDENDGGIETNIQVRCPQCSNEEAKALPFDKTFWMPTRRRP